MNTETQILATTILSVAEGTNNYDYVSGVYPKTGELIESFIEENKKHEMVENEDGDYEKTCVGYKNEELDKVLKHLKTSFQKDKAEITRFESQSNKYGKDKIKLIKKITKPYALKIDDEN